MPLAPGSATPGRKDEGQLAQGTGTLPAGLSRDEAGSPEKARPKGPRPLGRQAACSNFPAPSTKMWHSL
eukprot:960615-Alexandrium_andersonii.AAC.1